MRRSLLALILVLAACATPEEEDQALSPNLIRRALIGGTLIGGLDTAPVYLYFAPNGVAVRNGAVAEFGQWRVDEGKGLCLNWRETGESCAPVYQVHTGRYRIGDVEYNLYRRTLGGYGPGMGFGSER